MADRKRESNQIGDLASNGRDLYVTARRRGCNGSGDAIDMPAHAFSGERAGD
jgi:hypothetical protein